MRDKDLYTQILGISPPWEVTDVELSVDSGEVKVFIEQRSGLSWNAIDRIMQRAVGRGLARRTVMQPEHIGVDETSFRKRHDYVTVVSDGSKVLYVSDDRKRTSLAGFYEGLTEEQISAIKSVSMDMWPAYIRATRNAIPDAAEKVAFDKFHVAKYLGDQSLEALVKLGGKMPDSFR